MKAKFGKHYYKGNEPWLLTLILMPMEYVPNPKRCKYFMGIRVSVVSRVRYLYNIFHVSFSWSAGPKFASKQDRSDRTRVMILQLCKIDTSTWYWAIFCQFITKIGKNVCDNKVLDKFGRVGRSRVIALELCKSICPVDNSRNIHPFFIEPTGCICVADTSVFVIKLDHASVYVTLVFAIENSWILSNSIKTQK